jgi:hypothetical protein
MKLIPVDRVVQVLNPIWAVSDSTGILFWLADHCFLIVASDLHARSFTG